MTKKTTKWAKYRAYKIRNQRDQIQILEEKLRLSGNAIIINAPSPI